MTNIPPKKLPKFIKDLYLSVNKHLEKAMDAEAKISEWFDKYGLDMISYDSEGQYLPLLSGDARRIYSSEEEAMSKLEEVYTTLVENYGLSDLGSSALIDRVHCDSGFKAIDDLENEKGE